MKKIRVVVGDPMKFIKGKDAIVNPQNRYMIKGSGLNRKIYEAAGERLLTTFCEDYYQEQMEQNEVRVTPGFNLGMDIIHFFAPKYHFTEDPIEELRQGYQKIFAEIERNNYKNVIMTSLGVGVPGYTHQDVAEMVIKAMKNFTANKKINITLVVSNRKIKKLYDKHL